MKPERKFLKPARPGMVVRDPRGFAKLPEKGKWVNMTSYWVRRLLCGDVVEASEAKPTSSTQTPRKTSTKTKSAEE